MCTDRLLRYLERYGEAEARAVSMPGREFGSAVVIPCYDEAPECIDAALQRVAGSVLAIVVVNAPDDAPAAALARSRAMWRALAGGGGQPLQWGRTPGGIEVLAIDRCSGQRRVPRRQGVGLARKLGADIACALIARGAVRSPWIYFTDADVRLPAGYLDAPPAQPGSLVMPFRHIAEPGLAGKARTYELYLRYYVDRLRHARSPYAFHTIGSAMAIHAEVYARVRGVPRRNAGEDFHLLNKAAKTAPVFAGRGEEIAVRARLSDRVPFGTGPALRAMEDAASFPGYAPESFDLLRQATAFIDRGTALQAPARQLLEELGFFRQLQSARRRTRHPHTLAKALHQWFDALRTLRFIHLARRHHPDRPLAAILEQLFGSVDHLALLKDRERRAEPGYGIPARANAAANSG